MKQEADGKEQERQTFPRQAALKGEKNQSWEKGRRVMSRNTLLKQEKQRSKEREALRGAGKDRLMSREPGAEQGGNQRGWKIRDSVLATMEAAEEGQR